VVADVVVDIFVAVAGIAVVGIVVVVVVAGIVVPGIVVAAVVAPLQFLHWMELAVVSVVLVVQKQLENQ